MTVPMNPASPVRLEFDEVGNLREPTGEQCLSILTQWANNYPCARFAVAAIDGLDSDVLGWGLALPEFVFTFLPSLAITGRFSTADKLLNLLRSSLDARLIWVDPEPEHWPEGDDE